MKKYLTNVPLLIAAVLVLMDLSGLVGQIGYILYYPLLFLCGFIALRHQKKTTPVYIIFVVACLASVILNSIPGYYKLEQRIPVFILLLISFTPLFNSKYLSEYRLKFLQYFCFLTVFAVALNYILFTGGGVNSAQMDFYDSRGLYTGTTANNEMGALAAFSQIYCTSLLLFRKVIYSKITIICIIVLMAISFPMLLLASSRSAIICAGASIIAMVYVKNRKSAFKLIGTGIVMVGVVLILFTVFGDYMRGIIEFKQGGDMENFDTHSRDNLWDLRIEEWKSSPIFGIGFGTVSNPSYMTLVLGMVETGSSWLALFSQLGLFGAIPVIIIVFGNLKYLLFNKSNDFFHIMLTGMTVFFTIHPMAEGYFTTVGAILCVLFWTIHGIVYSLRTKVFQTSDVPTLIINQKKISL